MADNAYQQSGTAEDNAEYPRGYEAKDNTTYCHGSPVKDNVTYCHGGAVDNNTMLHCDSAIDNNAVYFRSGALEDGDTYHQSGEADNLAAYPCGGEAKDNATYHHGSAAKDHIVLLAKLIHLNSTMPNPCLKRIDPNPNPPLIQLPKSSHNGSTVELHNLETSQSQHLQHWTHQFQPSHSGTSQYHKMKSHSRQLDWHA